MNYRHNQLRISKARQIRLLMVKFFVFIPGDVGDTVSEVAATFADF